MKLLKIIEHTSRNTTQLTAKQKDLASPCNINRYAFGIQKESMIKLVAKLTNIRMVLGAEKYNAFRKHGKSQDNWTCDWSKVEQLCSDWLENVE